MKQASWKLNHRTGFALIETLIAIVAVGIIVLSIAQMTQLFLRTTRLSYQKTEAAFLIQEGAEAIRFLRDEGWHDHIDTIATGTPYYLLFQANEYTATTIEPVLIDGIFARTVTFSDVFRDNATDDITQSGGTLSTSTKRVTMSVSWRRETGTTTEAMEFFISDIFDN